mgnify:CR=1 FL=1
MCCNVDYDEFAYINLLLIYDDLISLMITGSDERVNNNVSHGYSV